MTENFTIKVMRAEGVEREAARLKDLRQAIDEANAGGEFALPEHLAELDVGDGNRRCLRRYVPGNSARIVVERESVQRADALLKRIAAFLALMNRVESASPEGVRRGLKEREVGRWLRAIGERSHIEAFEQWWSLVSGVKPVRRRDAHLDNWVLTSDGCVLALDLEAIGSRPAGYELAQVTDDAPLLAPGDWRRRREIFDAYLAGLGQQNVADITALWVSYQAAVAARALRRLTLDNASSDDQAHAQATLEGLADNVQQATLSDWARRVLTAWRRTRGLSDLKSEELAISDHRRIRVSRSMAYHLRHGEMVNVDGEGWASVADLACAIANGVTEREVAIVASTLSDPRFEFRDGLVRARYGHSRTVTLDDAKIAFAGSPPRAFHATSTSGAARIFDAREGLRPMSRIFVHLSRSAPEAIRAGARHGYPLLLVTDGRRARSLISRGGQTVVAPRLGFREIAIETLASHWPLLPPIVAQRLPNARNG
ncbi:RNA 2'-phosphotransferase [Demequina litorisediminis]|uniref:RNA 2'-phosphotransferase n=1 Tax=Demequina litorisediminis TaxID=1849022 RepID=UPI0024E139B4|nr:RNA 2'-phosphotransferase [Demequina litorisediminis]